MPCSQVSISPRLLKATAVPFSSSTLTAALDDCDESHFCAFTRLNRREPQANLIQERKEKWNAAGAEPGHEAADHRSHGSSHLLDASSGDGVVGTAIELDGLTFVGSPRSCWGINDPRNR